MRGKIQCGILLHNLVPRRCVWPSENEEMVVRGLDLAQQKKA